MIKSTVSKHRSVDDGAIPIVDRAAAMTRDRRHFIGGSDARAIMGKDEKAFLRLWKEERGDRGFDRPVRPGHRGPQSPLV